MEYPFRLPDPLSVYVNILARGYAVIEDFVPAVRAQAWAGEILGSIHRATSIEKPAGGPGAIGDEPLIYRVMDTGVVYDVLPDLYSAYVSSRLWKWVHESTGSCNLHLNEDSPTALNVNILPTGGFYQAHKDSQSYVGLLFLQTIPVELGGGTEFWVSDRMKIVFQPVAGTFVLFDGAELPHRVQTYKGSGYRLSVPMNFFPAGPEDPALLDYLVGAGS